MKASAQSNLVYHQERRWDTRLFNLRETKDEVFCQPKAYNGKTRVKDGKKNNHHEQIQ
jgi:hypothetical protein